MEHDHLTNNFRIGLLTSASWAADSSGQQMSTSAPFKKHCRVSHPPLVDSEPDLLLSTNTSYRNLLILLLNSSKREVYIMAKGHHNLITNDLRQSLALNIH